jgi:hypothetical protein
MRKLLKVVLLLFIFLSSGLALLLNFIGEFDPVQMAIDLKNDNERDQALDVIGFSIENNIGNQQELEALYDEYQYDATEKLNDLFWDGAVKGNVFNVYSGIGCVAADLAVVGDVRDLTKEGISLLTGKDVDYVVAALSAIGVGTTVAEATGVGAPVDAGVSVIKTIVKYASKVLKKIPDSILKTAISAKKFSAAVYEKVWILFKETNFSAPNVATILSKIRDIKYLDPAIAVTKRLKKGGAIFINKTGEAGLKTYESFNKLKLGDLFISAFKRNPKGVLGITKFHTFIHSVKILKKQGFLIPLVLILTFLANLLAMFPFWVPLIVFLASGGYIGWSIHKRMSEISQSSKRDNREVASDGKKEFYIKAEEALKSNGFQYFDGDRDIRGKGRRHASKPDYIAIKNNFMIIGETKSPKEGPESSSWRQIQNGDSKKFRAVRNEVKRREERGDVKKEVGGHEIIIKGQIPDYVTKIGETYDLPTGVLENISLKGGYTVPVNESSNVEEALKNCKKDDWEKINSGNGSVTYIFPL